MKGEWEINRGNDERPRERIDPALLMDLEEALQGLIRVQLMNLDLSDSQLADLIRDNAEAGVTLEGKTDGTWSLALEKIYGALWMNWRLTTAVENEDQIRVVAHLSAVIKDRGGMTLDPLDGYPGVTCHLELGEAGVIRSGSIGFGTNGADKDFVTLNYLNTEHPPERVVVCRGGIDGRMIDSGGNPESFRSLSINLGVAIYPAHGLLEVPLGRAVQLITETCENSLVESTEDMVYLINYWWHQFTAPISSLMPF